jgi:iron only hydrogenase large subunit-like protein
MGAFVKTKMAADRNATPDQIYHVTIMPCPDKKLEASRSEFYSDVYSTRDVDLVLTTSDVVLLMDECGVQFEALAEASFDPPIPSATSRVVSHRGSSAGGYLEHVFVGAAETLFNVADAPVTYTKAGRRSDIHEVSLEVEG